MGESYRIPQNEVVSTNIKAIGYDAERKVLAVTFNNGAIWHYAGVSYEQAEAFWNAESFGRYFYANIKGKFSALKMTGICPKCGAKGGYIGERCDDCGCAEVEREPRPFVEDEKGRTPIGGTAA